MTSDKGQNSIRLKVSRTPTVDYDERRDAAAADVAADVKTAFSHFSPAPARPIRVACFCLFSPRLLSVRYFILPCYDFLLVALLRPAASTSSALSTPSSSN